MKIGVVAFTTTLMLAGASHAGDKIAFICSDGKGKDDYSLSIDLDRKLASFHMSDLPDADGIPVTRVTENYIFKIKLCPAFIRKGSWIELPDRSTFFIGISTTQKTYIYGASQ
jgi:hypothetical protein